MPIDQSGSRDSTARAAVHVTHHGSVSSLALGALGVVFGDIGTSPLYTLAQCVKGDRTLAQVVHAGNPAEESILGILSLIFWALTLVVTLKYLTFIMRADNRGEGGILALLALIPTRVRAAAKSRIGWVALLVIAGAALLYGDGIITPAISVLSAIEGLKLAAPSLEQSPEIIVLVTVVILIGLFAIQSRGTGVVGKLFGPVMVLWFVTIGGLGLFHVAKNPAVLAALSPVHAVRYFANGGPGSFWILGAVVLAVTGGEALYADMGHFGARPIRLAWIGLVMPALVLAYFGQGALLLSADKLPPEQANAIYDNPFFSMVPTGPLTYILVVLSTLATIIASQALISGAFSLTHQAVQLGFFPRVTVKHTSREAEGQIYVPAINWALAVACIVLVLAFQKSDNLAAAYGIAVSGTMAITSVVFFVVTRNTWGWPLYKALPLLVLFLAIDLPFFVANAIKFIEGGYVPILVGAAVLTIMVNWKIGRSVLRERLLSTALPLKDFLAKLDTVAVTRVPGTAIVLSSFEDVVPPVITHKVKRIHVLHERVILLTVLVDHVPAVDPAKRMRLETLEKGFFRVVAHYGFMEKPNIPYLLLDAETRLGIPIDLAEATYYVGRETFLATSAGKMGSLSEGLFSFLSRNAKNATSYFNLPPDQVVEIGTQLDL